MNRLQREEIEKEVKELDEKVTRLNDFITFGKGFYKLDERTQDYLLKEYSIMYCLLVQTRKLLIEIKY